MRFTRLWAVLAVLSATTFGAQADQLADIKAKGQMVCGTLGTAEPFSFQDPKTRDIVGYDVDMCRKIADALGVKLELKPMAVEARIPELTQGRVDILAANLGYTKERAQQIDYSHSYFVSLQKILVTKELGVTRFDQLAGKKVTAIKGSTSEQGVRRLIPNAQTVTFQDQSAAFLALTQDKVDAFCASELNLVKLQKQSQAVPLVIIDQTLFVEPWGLGLRKSEPAFKEAVNKVLSDLDASGEADRIFTRWFGPDTVYNIKRDFKIAEIKD